ncbi:MAG TPA: hypothetical protein VGM06_13665 [Polyangiaceae bacterium]
MAVPALALAMGAPLLALSSPARAQAQAQPRSGDAAMAETLFNEGKARMAAGDYAGACPKLAESNRLDPGSGTLTALAVCHESLGKTASAWTEFIQVVSDARQAGRTDREQFAQQHVDALAPKLSKLTIVVDPSMAGVPGLEVKRDGTVIGEAGWGTAAPVDPGSHTIEVAAIGKKTWSTTIDVGAEADVQTVNVPPLEDGAPGGATDTGAAGATSIGAEGNGADKETPAAPEHSATGAGNGQRTAGLVVGGAGVVAAAVGTFFGLQALSKRHDATSACPPPATTCSDMSAVNSNNDAKSAAVVADVAFGGALVGVALGAILYFTAPTEPAPSPAASGKLHILPVASSTGVSLLVDGRF